MTDRLPNYVRGEGKKLRHHLLRRHRVGRIAAHHAGGLGEDAAVAELHLHVSGGIVGALERHLVIGGYLDTLGHGENALIVE